MTAPCSISGCDLGAEWGRRGWCEKHYTRWRRHGDPNKFVQVQGEPWLRWHQHRVGAPRWACWFWDSDHSANGYARLSVDGKKQYAHRWAYEQVSAEPVPSDLQLDHICNERGCVNPWHQEVVTPGENIRRSWERTRREVPA